MATLIPALINGGIIGIDVYTRWYFGSPRKNLVLASTQMRILFVFLYVALVRARLLSVERRWH